MGEYFLDAAENRESVTWDLADKNRHLISQTLRELDQANILEFVPGGFIYRGHHEPLRGRALQVLKVLSHARNQTCTAKDLISEIWKDALADEATVRKAVSNIRRALRTAVKAVGFASDENPVPTVDRGDGRLAWQLKLP
jgi:hypothetical protein